MTLRELADAVNMSPAELREWFPWVAEPATPDNVCVAPESVAEVLLMCGEGLAAHLP